MIALKLQHQQHLGRLRQLTTTTGLIDLTSNDYFGFAQRKRSQTAPAGATGSRLLTGNSSFYEELEQQIADFHNAESCLIFNSGYTANIGLISALGTPSSTFLYDLEIHASMIDGMRLGKGTCVPFRHNNLDSLERRLRKAKPPIFVLVESLYSVSGDIAPLQEISNVCNRYHADLIVDEAHATGVCGPRGEGLVRQLQLEAQVFARIHTFSKALGTHGGCVLGSSELKQYLINFSRPLIYTTALPPLMLHHIGESYRCLKREAPYHQRKLQRLIAYWGHQTGMHTTTSPIQALRLGSSHEARAVSQRLCAQGIDVRALVPPTVGKGQECLRIVFHSFNQEHDIDQLLQGLS